MKSLAKVREVLIAYKELHWAHENRTRETLSALAHHEKEVKELVNASVPFLHGEHYLTTKDFDRLRAAVAKFQ